MLRTTPSHQSVEGQMDGIPSLPRQWAILQALSARRYRATLRELAEEHGVSRKTMTRDQNVLRRGGFRLVERAVEHGRKRWMAEHDPAAPLVLFNIGELLA